MALMTILVVVGALAFSLSQAKVFRATAQVLLSRQDIAASATGTPTDPTLSGDPARYAQTQASIARSSAVAKLALAKAKLRDRTPADLLTHSSVTASANADVLVFSVEDFDALVAARLVNAYTAAFSSYKLQLDTAALQKARAQLNEQLSALRAQNEQTTAEYRTLAADEQQLHTMQLLKTEDPVLSHPSEGVQIEPTPKRDALLGLGFGLILSVGFAFALEALDTRVNSEDELEESLAMPLLARLPKPPRQLREGGGLTMLEEPRSAHAEAMRNLATNIRFVSPDQPTKLILFTSAGQREGKSTTVANLAVALARGRSRVALVDLDLRQPTIASLFGIESPAGVTDVSIGLTPLEDALVTVSLAGTEPRRAVAVDDQDDSTGSLHVLPAGQLPASPGELVGSDALATRVLAPLQMRFDYILLDTPPMGVVGDAATLSARVDAVVVVARLGVVSRRALRDVKRQLVASPAPVLGFVIADAEVSESYGYAEQYGRSEIAAAPSSNGAAPPAATKTQQQRRARI